MDFELSQDILEYILPNCDATVKMKNFWDTPAHNAVRNMLRLVVEIESKGLPSGATSAMQRPYHRGIYKYSGLLFDVIGQTKDSVQEMPNLNKPQEYFMSIVYLSLCWCVVKLHLPIGSESLTQEVLGRIDDAYGKNNDFVSACLDKSFDRLVEKAGGDSVCFESIVNIGRYFGIRDFETLYHRFMGYHCREEVGMLDNREKFLTSKDVEL